VPSKTLPSEWILPSWDLLWGEADGKARREGQGKKEKKEGQKEDQALT